MAWVIARRIPPDITRFGDRGLACETVHAPCSPVQPPPQSRSFLHICVTSEFTAALIVIYEGGTTWTPCLTVLPCWACQPNGDGWGHEQRSNPWFPSKNKVMSLNWPVLLWWHGPIVSQRFSVWLSCASVSEQCTENAPSSKAGHFFFFYNVRSAADSDDQSSIHQDKLDGGRLPEHMVWACGLKYPPLKQKNRGLRHQLLCPDWFLKVFSTQANYSKMFFLGGFFLDIAKTNHLEMFVFCCD